MSRSIRWCRKCSFATSMEDFTYGEAPTVTCPKCGGTGWDRQPLVHTKSTSYVLIDWQVPTWAIQSDQDFLRIQGINPEGD